MDLFVNDANTRHGASDATVLYVDDSPEDRQLMELAFQMEKGRVGLRTLDSGEAALKYLGGTNGYADRHRHPRPAIVLLDLKMIGMNGFEVLDWVRQNPATTKLPVAIFSSSFAESDIERCYELGADFFLTKPNAWERMRAVVARLHECLSRTPPDFEPMTSLPECKQCAQYAER